ncbi:MAG TPA: ATP-binding protein [Polyangia bacterium]|nr:ATP-binding protein [Polyangia bacterium]
MRSIDWASTALGPVVGWPQSLRTAVSICLSSRFPIVLWWGRELVMIYNDAYRPMLGMTKHPRAMGQPGLECWPEIAHIIGPMLEGVLERGEATWSEDQMLPLDRNGFVEECYFTFSYSPIRDESGGVGGVFTAVTEVTGRVIGERRLHVLRALGERAAEAKSVETACSGAVRALAEDPADVPFALLYVTDPEGGAARLMGGTGLAAVGPASPEVIRLDAAAGAPWPLGRVAQTRQVELCDLGAGLGPLHAGLWPEPLRQAVVLPIARGQREPYGFLVAGVSPRLALSDPYMGFLVLAAGHVATAIANARAHEEERQRAEALARLDHAKTTFFSNVSHELRTPLTLILGPLEDALAARVPALGGEGLRIVHRNALRLLKLVNSLLEFSRIEAGRAQACYEPTDLATFTAELASVFRSTIERGGLALVVDCPPLPGTAYVDREMWEKIVLNLVSNAFKFTFAGSITVALRAVGGGFELEVRDTGTGIPTAELPRLFERFHRVEGARGRTYEGSGIGLALIHELVRLHGGTIRVESTEGQGSAFTVSLPEGAAHLPQDRIGARRGLTSTATHGVLFVEEAQRWLPEEEPAEPAEAAPPAAPREGEAKPLEDRPRVLLADDNADMRDYLARLLGERYTVEAVGDGEAALRAARLRPPDLVLADVMMPRLDGFGLLRELRAEPMTRTVPVVMLSARAGEEARVEGMAAGADDYLIKPFSARELLARVNTHLELSRLRLFESLLRERLLGIIGHDLRNPLTAISVAAQGMAMRRDLGEREARAAGRIAGSAGRMQRMISQLLDFTRIQQGGGLRPQLAPADLGEVARLVVEELATAHPDARITLQVAGDTRGTWDADLLAEVISNLVGNAVQHGAREPILARVGPGQEGVQFAVHNRGEPIPAEFLPYLFDPFRRARAPGAKSSHQGLGLGLFIAQQIARAHGGRIAVVSAAEEGTTFTLHLPRQPGEGARGA